MVAAVTGSNGFIGSHLVKALEAKGIEVFRIDRKLLQHQERLQAVIMNIRPDYIFHLSAYGNMANQKDEQEIFDANVVGTFNLLEAIKNLSYKAFINVGSSSEYGKKDYPMHEMMLPEADTFYGCSKVASTYLCRAFAKQLTKPIVTVRPFSVYGPEEAEFRFIPQVIKHLKENRVMNVDTGANHDWIYIDDMIDGLLTVSQHARELFGQVIDIGTGVEHSNQEVISVLEDLAGKHLEVNVFDNTRPNDSKVWVDGSGKLLKYGWVPSWKLRDGLEKCFEYYK